MPRLFTALQIPSELAAELAALRGGLSGARWIDPESYHITLRFIGDIDDATARDVFQELTQIRRPAFTVAIDRLSAFGGAKPRALVARAQPTQPLLELQAEQERLMRRIGLAPELRKFTPHVTLARLRSVSALEAAAFLGMLGLFREREFVADRFVLLSARALVGGGPYVLEAAYPLG